MSGYWTHPEGRPERRLVRRPRWRSGWFLVALEILALLAIAAWGWLAH